jgi:hypothetical protein
MGELAILFIIVAGWMRAAKIIRETREGKRPAGKVDSGVFSVFGEKDE